MKRILFLTFIFFMISIFLYSQNCFDGDIVCGDTISGTTVDGSLNFDVYSCCNWEEGGKEKIYRFTLDQWTRVDFSFESLGADLDMFILTDCADSNSCIAYGDNEIVKDLDPGTYYLVIDGYNGSEGEFSFSFSCLFSCVDEEITGDIDEVGNTTNGDNVISHYVCAGSNDFSGSEYVYHFHLDGEKIVKIELITSYNLSIFLLTDCNDGDTCIDVGTDGLIKKLSAGDYYISIDSPPSEGGNYRIIVNFYDCFDKEITGTSYSDSDTTYGGNRIYDNYNCYNGDESGPEKIYKFSLSESSLVDVYLSNEASPHRIFILNECGDPSSCIATGVGELTQNLASGSYYLVIDSDDGLGSQYDLDFYSTPSSCFLSEISCGSTINGNTQDGIAQREHYSCGFYDEVGKECVYKFNMSEDGYVTVKLSGDSNLRVYLLTDCEDEGSCIGYGSFQFTKMISSGTYFLSVDSSDLENHEFTLQVDCTLLDCYDDSITGAGDYSGNTSSGESNINSYTDVSWDESGKEYIYKIKIDEDSFLGITFDPSPPVDLDLFLLSDCRSGDNLIAYGNECLVVNNLEKGFYFLSVDGVSEGDFTINVSIDSPLKMGDLNGDGAVNISDVSLLAGFLTGNLTSDEINGKAADVKYDLKVNSVDLVVLQNFIVGNIDNLPYEERKGN